MPCRAMARAAARSLLDAVCGLVDNRPETTDGEYLALIDGPQLIDLQYETEMKRWSMRRRKLQRPLLDQSCTLKRCISFQRGLKW
jgi:hypothetical protein